MKQSLWAGIAGLSCLALAATPAFARAMMIAPPPLSQRAAMADVIVVGKVTGFGDKLVSAAPPGGGNKVDYQIATVQVTDPISGLKDVKEIKVGFIPPEAAPPPPPPGGPFIIRKRYPQFNLTLDQEACLFLVKHPTEDFYVGQAYYDVIGKNNADFDKSMDEVKHCVKLLADPMAALKGKNADDRFLTAAMLIARYRTAKPGETKTEPIDAEESKQVLQALADADWNAKPAPGAGSFFQMTPLTAFFRLGVTPQDGWMQPPDAKNLPDSARQWVKDNVEKYRIQRFVADKKDK